MKSRIGLNTCLSYQPIFQGMKLKFGESLTKFSLTTKEIEYIFFSFQEKRKLFDHRNGHGDGFQIFLQNIWAIQSIYCSFSFQPPLSPSPSPTSLTVQVPPLQLVLEKYAFCWKPKSELVPGSLQNILSCPNSKVSVSPTTYSCFYIDGLGFGQYCNVQLQRKITAKLLKQKLESVRNPSVSCLTGISCTADT